MMSGTFQQRHAQKYIYVHKRNLRIAQQIDFVIKHKYVPGNLIKIACYRISKPE